jgi:hypothetical protein
LRRSLGNVTPATRAASPRLPAVALNDFRAFARKQGITVPTGPEADSWLQAALVLRVASAKWGEAGYYRVVVPTDPEVAAASKAFDQAAAMLSTR